ILYGIPIGNTLSWARPRQWRLIMAVRKIAISVPEEVLREVDRLAKRTKTTRSALITKVLKEVSRASNENGLISRINSLFADESIREEQTQTATLFLHSPRKGYGESEW